MGQVKAVLMLRNGMVFKKLILNPCEKDDESFPKSKEEVKPTIIEDKTEPSPAP